MPTIMPPPPSEDVGAMPPIVALDDPNSSTETSLPELGVVEESEADADAAAAVAAAAFACEEDDDADDQEEGDDDEDDEGGTGTTGDGGTEKKTNSSSSSKRRKSSSSAAAAAADGQRRVRRNKKLPLTPHEALAFFHRGIYIDVDPNNISTASAAALAERGSSSGNNFATAEGLTMEEITTTAKEQDEGFRGGGGINLLFSNGIIRCSCNHKSTYKWDAYGYARHFEFKCHRKYEIERLDDVEAARLQDSKEAYLRMHPLIQSSNVIMQHRKKRRFHEDVEGDKILSVDELRVQERHWMEMWKDAKNELKQLRDDLKSETDEEVRKELLSDIEGWKKRKGDWATLLGLNECGTVKGEEKEHFMAL